VVTNVLDQALETVRTGLAETRRALKALRATPLDDLGLVKAVKNLAESAAARAHLELILDLPDETLFIPPDVEQGIYRILQEAVENTVHHAKARTLKISLQNTGDEIIIEVADDGAGFSVKGHQEGHHFGLKNMQERAQLAGGTLTITSQAGKGTVIRCIFKEKHA
jgi:signal transduction histidine kinase